MTEYKLISCDLDGTLLADDMTVSDENLKAIDSISDMGIEVVLNTGRTYNQIPKALRESESIRYYAYSNGAVVYDKKTDTVISATMPKELLCKAIDIFYEYDTKVFTHAHKQAYVDSEKNDSERCLSVYHMSQNFTTLAATDCIAKDNYPEFCREFDEAEMFCVFFSDDSELEACRERLLADGRYRVTSSAPHNIEVSYVKANKGAALRAIAEILDTEPERAIAIGDTMNDSAQLAAAGLAIATENAVPELKEMADLITVSNEDNVMCAIYEFLKENDPQIEEINMNTETNENTTEPDASCADIAAAPEAKPSKKSKNILLIIAAVAIAAVVIGTVISGFIHGESVTKIGYIGSHDWDSWSGTYAYLDGEMKHTVRVDSGTLYMSIKTESGMISVTVKDSEGNTVFDEDNIQTGTFDIKINGKAYISIEADSHKGSFVIGD